MADPDELPSAADDLPAAFAAPSGRSSVGEARFLVEQVGDAFEAKIRAPLALAREVARQYFNGEEIEPRRAVRIDFAARTITLWPQILYFSEQLYQRKYARLTEIVVDLEGQHGQPRDHEDLDAILATLSSGFIKDPTYGLGFVLEMRPLVKAIEEVREVTRLVIARCEQTRVEGDTFYLNGEEFARLRSGMNRIARTHQAESLIEREIMSFNASTHIALPMRFPPKAQPYRPGTIYKLLGGTQQTSVPLRGKDRVSLLNAIAANARAIAQRDPQEFVQLQKDVELASLDQLIAAVQRHIERNSDEGVWQILLELNPFILSMLFGQPIVLLQPSASVGGQTLTGAGTKIVDFLTKNAVTHNVAIVELKRPKTPLFAREYRGGVHPPSWDLIGAVTQVLDQRLRLVTGIMATKYNNPGLKLDVSAVECVVVAGLVPTEPEQVKSLELVRNQFKDVRIVTFDELAERLQLLRELLSGERYVSTHDDESNVPDGLPIAGNGFDAPDDEDRDPWAD